MQTLTRFFSAALSTLFLVIIGSQVALAEESQAEHSLIERARAEEIGRKASQVALSELQTSLKDALAEGGPVHAAAFCNVELPSISERIMSQVPEGVKLKRVAIDYRNPKNIPDAFDVQIIREYERQLERGVNALEPTLRFDAGTDRYRYYHPLRVGATCLTCHGDKENFTSDLKDLLKAKYPSDAAYGYRLGEVRGALRVAIPKKSP